MDTKAFNEKNFDKSRAVCEGIEREDGDGRVVLTDREREILDMWPKFEDGEYVRIGDAVEVHHDGAIIIEAIEFSRDKVHVKDAEDGDWNTSMYAMRQLKRPAPKVLDANGVEIKVGDTVWCDEDNKQCEVIELVGGTVRVQYQNGYTLEHYPSHLTHTRPDSWERLEEDAKFNDETGIVGGNLDIVYRAKALAGVE